MDSLTTRFYDEVFSPYLDLLKAEYRFHPKFEHAKRGWEESLTMKELVNGPYLEKSQMYAPGDPLDTLPLHTKTVETVRERLGGRSLYKHQTDALKLVLGEKNAVIATGTSSGKTLCFQVPILDDLIRDPSPGLRAIIIYPLNALVNDQLEEWERMLEGYRQITFARFTGQTPNSKREYEERLRDVFREQLADIPLTLQEKEREVARRLHERLQSDHPNRLNHRDDIRANPPQILITNFSMLEYLMERPVDAPIFKNARMKFLVLDEAHAYRGVQATEIAFLIRRLKDRLGLETLTCIATSATLGRPDDPHSTAKVRRFASELFGEDFPEPNPIYGTAAEPQLAQPSFRPVPTQYIEAAESLRDDDEPEARRRLWPDTPAAILASLLNHDENLYRLRREILTKPTLLSEAAKSLWLNNPQAEEGLQSLLEIVATAKQDELHEDLLPTRLHYFVRAQDGLHICLHKQCPGRRDGKPEFFVSRKINPDTPEGFCPSCSRAGRLSKLVEVVTCRKCGYLYGALQDLGPRRARNPENDDDTNKPYFDSFTTELGWAADSFWSYFSAEDDLPYPPQPNADDEDDDQDDLFLNPAELSWCVVCGKKNDRGTGDNCVCESPHLRKIKIFHRQCPHSGRTRDADNLYSQQKKLLTSCPNCGARNSSGLEPVRRFQECDDETGLAMAIPLSHFQVSPPEAESKPPRKLLCFTDHRQRAAAFPALLEEETFAHDLGRQIVRIVYSHEKPLDFISLGDQLADLADPNSDNYDPDFFLPASRVPDEELDAKEKRNLWLAEVFSYFGIPDAARESAEDSGLVAIEYQLREAEKSAFHELLSAYAISFEDSMAGLQVLLGFMRQRKAFTLPPGRVAPDALAFGRITADIAYALRREGQKYTQGWLPRVNNNGSYQDNFITSYLRRLLALAPSETLDLAERIWQFLTSQFLLDGRRDRWKLFHENLSVVKPTTRYVCSRCGLVTAYSARQCCPRKECIGKLESKPFELAKENIIARWVAGLGELQFTTLKSEEHTAQISKELAKIIEDEFRAEGVNLLSSTTTFEMGINIGDLQKVLLRNAPPSSASYVQRVGRAGRGKDKNAVCVTLCRRTKYDADAWADPPRLMSGAVRTPTVFIGNPFIAQRHFNAVAFARFLRIKVADERVLGEVKQQIRLEAFLPVDYRMSIPEGWFQIRPISLYLDFLAWLDIQDETDIFHTQAGRTLLSAVFDFETAKQEAKKAYQETLTEIAEELAALKTERQRLFQQGDSTGGQEIDRAIKNLLGSDVIAVLAKRGFLPRYAFPLDVVPLETGWSRWSQDKDVELSRDRGIAIAEFAPGAQVIAHKRVFTSAGLYVFSRTDKPNRQWYSRCPGCEQIRTSPTQEPLITNCSVCQRPITTQHIKPFVEPVAFSVRIDKKGTGASRHRRTSLIRQRQTLTHFIDSVEDSSFQDFGLFSVALKDAGTLFRYNLGPENKGFILCHVCGHSEPLRGFKAGRKHKRLRASLGTMDCANEHPWTKPLAYGHQFRSFCLIARPTVMNPPIESLAFALQKGLCKLLDLEPFDIGVSWRWLANRKAGAGARAEIILYDRTPGGAGFVKEGFDNWLQVVEQAHEICDTCSCESACYDCLKDYSNQSYHEKLNRLSVRGLLGV
jgi:hypothetical protein